MSTPETARFMRLAGLVSFHFKKLLDKFAKKEGVPVESIFQCKNASVVETE
ncbi:hypothetical protein [Haladaptatus cibarius]|uniref:hypothetical protein n=1 Tax=Haladaptatus cibarius TaxID=453847 RepID=UPI0013922103|nr:hypothetical protein [Haladaptatus cibarius]